MKTKLKNLGVFKDSSDGTIKSVFENEDKGIIEVSLLKNKPNMDVICVPTHHFCDLGCKMCHLTKEGLTEKSIKIKSTELLEAIIRSVCKQLTDNRTDLIRRTEKRKLLISFMGVGEPTLNKELILEIFKLEEEIKKLGYDEISYAVSTMMPNEALFNQFIEMVDENNIPLKVHFSLHSPNNDTRKSLIPNSKMDIEGCLECLSNYRRKITSNSSIMERYSDFHRTSDPVEIHYTLIKGVNDSRKELDELCFLLEKYNIPIKFITFNPKGDMEVSNNQELWVNEIKRRVDVRVKEYSPPGKEVGSSCGEFTKHYYHSKIETDEEKEEFEKWKKAHEIFELQRDKYLSTEDVFTAMAILISTRSKDPSTQVGACIIDKNNILLSLGYNGTPDGWDDESFKWGRTGDSLDTKYPYVIHAERNAILHSNGGDLHGARLFVALFPCNECAKEIVQSGIKEVIYLSDKYKDTPETIASKTILDKGGVKYRQYIPKMEEITLRLRP